MDANEAQLIKELEQKGETNLSGPVKEKGSETKMDLYQMTKNTSKMGKIVENLQFTLEKYEIK